MLAKQLLQTHPAEVLVSLTVNLKYNSMVSILVCVQKIVSLKSIQAYEYMAHPSLFLVWQLSGKVTSHVFLYHSQVVGCRHLLRLSCNFSDLCFFANLHAHPDVEVVRRHSTPLFAPYAHTLQNGNDKPT